MLQKLITAAALSPFSRFLEWFLAALLSGLILALAVRVTPRFPAAIDAAGAEAFLNPDFSVEPQLYFLACFCVCLVWIQNQFRRVAIASVQRAVGFVAVNGRSSKELTARAVRLRNDSEEPAYAALDAEPLGELYGYRFETLLSDTKEAIGLRWRSFRDSCERRVENFRLFPALVE